MKTFTIDQARSAAAAGGVLSANLRPAGGSFTLEFETLTGPATLIASVSKKTRCFSNPIKAFEIVRELGLEGGRYSVAQWRPDERDAERAARPDRAAAMKEVHDAAAYTRWLENKVAVSRAGIADGTNKSYSEEEWARVRAAKRTEPSAA
jgi:hypothetical protein